MVYFLSMLNREKVSYSFELFPPKENFDSAKLTELVKELDKLSPSFISITYGAGGSARNNKTLEMCEIIKTHTQTNSVAHLTAVGSTKEEISIILDKLLQIGVKNILALRGDLPPGNSSATNPSPGDFPYASDLIKFIVDNYSSAFSITGACYPVGHVESKSLSEDIYYLQKKVEAGASTLITQLFFDNDEFFHFKKLTSQAKIEVPIYAGIMPLTSKKQIQRIVSLSGATIPAKLSRLIAKYGDDPTSMRQAGIDYAIEQIQDLLTTPIDGIHLYTMNNLEVAQKITLGIKDSL